MESRQLAAGAVAIPAVAAAALYASPLTDIAKRRRDFREAMLRRAREEAQRRASAADSAATAGPRAD